VTQRTEREFTAFVNERGTALLRVAYALTGDRHSAEDLLQSALAKTYVTWSRIRGDAEPYVRRILYHDQVSGWRRRARRPEVPVAALPDLATDMPTIDLNSATLVWVAAERLLLISDGHATLLDPAGHPLERRDLPPELTGLRIAVAPSA
jgi:DNA-directed RNA polymerase specialized sigma24 family protein